jgi:hypothetical protein
MDNPGSDEPLTPEAEAERLEIEKTLTEARVDEIVGMMCAGQWVTGLSHRQLAEAWEVSHGRIEVYAAEASRVIRRWVRESPEDKHAYLAQLIQTFERLAQKAEDRGSQRGYRDAIEANKVLAMLHGVLKQQVEIEESSPFKGWTREEKERFAATGERPAPRLREDAGE